MLGVWEEPLRKLLERVERGSRSQSLVTASYYSRHLSPFFYRSAWFTNIYKVLVATSIIVYQ